MKSLDLGTVLLAALGMFLLALGSLIVIEPLLPGSRATLVAAYELTGGSEPPALVMEMPLLRSASGLFLVMTPGAFGVLGAALLWRRSRRQEESDLATRRQRARWGDKVLDDWLDELELGWSDGRPDSRTVSRALEEFYPRLEAEDQIWMGRFIAVLRSPGTPATAIAEPFRSPVSFRPSHRVRVFSLAAGLLAAFLVFWGALNGIMQLYFEEVAGLEMPATASTLAFGCGGSWAGAAGFAALSAGLFLAERAARRRSAADELRRREHGASRTSRALSRLARPAYGSKHRLASALAVATLEAVDPSSRRPLLQALYERGFLSPPHPLDLRGVDLRGLDLTDFTAPGVHLQGVRLDDSMLIGAQLRRAVLDGSSLRRARLRNAMLRGASLRGVDLSGAQCQKACFVNACLTGTNLAGANCWGADPDPLLAEVS